MIALIYISQALQILGNNYFIDGSVKALIELDSTSCFAVTFIVSILITSCATIDNSHLANLKPERILCTMQRWHQVIHNTKYSLSWRKIISDSSRKFTLIFPWDFKFQAKKNYSQEYWLSLRFCCDWLSWVQALAWAHIILSGSGEHDLARFLINFIHVHVCHLMIQPTLAHNNSSVILFCF